MSAGLDASTVTPGRTPPDASFTAPAIAPAVEDWADALGSLTRAPAMSTIRNKVILCLKMSSSVENALRSCNGLWPKSQPLLRLDSNVPPRDLAALRLKRDVTRVRDVVRKSGQDHPVER